MNLGPIRPSLDHVEVQPFFVMEILGRGMPAVGVVGHGVEGTALPHSLGESAVNILKPTGCPVAAIHPNKIGTPAVPFAEPFSVGISVVGPHYGYFVDE